MRAIPDDNLGYPVMITVGVSSQGSGFFLNSGEVLFLVTAKHVLIDQESRLRANACRVHGRPRDPSEEGLVLTDLNLEKLEGNGNILPHPSHDVVVIKLGKLEPERGIFRFIEEAGVAISGKTKSPLVQVSRKFVTRINDVLVGNDAVLFGYPGSIGLSNHPQFDYSKPLLRKGIIAGKHLDARTIVIDCPVFPGNSGGPVLQIDFDGAHWAFRVVGVVSEFVPVVEKWKNLNYGYENTSVYNSGYSIAVAMDSILELVDG